MQVRTLDITAEKEYTYIYEDGIIVRAVESDITLNGEYVTSKTAVNTISYIYDSEGSLSKKEITSSDGNSFVYDYESNDGNQVLKFTAGNQKITSHSKSDSFGRKVFDEL